jgi:hypothetical protein
MSYVICIILILAHETFCLEPLTTVALLNGGIRFVNNFKELPRLTCVRVIKITSEGRGGRISFPRMPYQRWFKFTRDQRVMRLVLLGCLREVHLVTWSAIIISILHTEVENRPLWMNIASDVLMEYVETLF